MVRRTGCASRTSTGLSIRSRGRSTSRATPAWCRPTRSPTRRTTSISTCRATSTAPSPRTCRTPTVTLRGDIPERDVDALVGLICDGLKMLAVGEIDSCSPLESKFDFQSGACAGQARWWALRKAQTAVGRQKTNRCSATKPGERSATIKMRGVATVDDALSAVDEARGVHNAAEGFRWSVVSLAVLRFLFVLR